MHRPEPSPSPPKGRENIDGSNRSIKVNNATSSFSSSSASASSSSLLSSSPAASSPVHKRNAIQEAFGCYECRMVVDPIARDPSLRSTICAECGQIFMKLENLELHQAVRHAVSELGPEDTSRNIVEIIFQSSWLNKKTPVCKIDRILKIRNTPRTISRFEGTERGYQGILTTATSGKAHDNTRVISMRRMTRGQMLVCRGLQEG
ncbi:hypothetical protein HAX54_002314 [Datura stramonium]|uniref:C2H2-type domain-containing protein n=1 Tax=Datura stramonium TaxID=4076 RepID=A0ABS8WTB0_DATST|nr:hypothetical protein [Datura stramonium]